MIRLGLVLLSLILTFFALPEFLDKHLGELSVDIGRLLIIVFSALYIIQVDRYTARNKSNRQFVTSKAYAVSYWYWWDFGLPPKKEAFDDVYKIYDFVNGWMVRDFRLIHIPKRQQVDLFEELENNN